MHMSAMKALSLQGFNTIKSVGEGEFEKIADDVLLNMQDAQKNMLFQAYILMLNQEANVDILMPELFAKQ